MGTIVAPWPPQRNGIADYAWEIARASDEALTVVTEAMRPAPGGDMQEIIGPAAFLAAPRDGALIYHIGNNPDHAFMAPLFLRRPGVVALHDLSLHYLAQEIDKALPGFYAAQLRAERPEIAALLERIAPAGLTREMDHREIRLLSWLRAAPALIVHSHAARRIVAGALRGMPVHVVPHFCYLPGPSLNEVEAWRDAVRDPVRARWMGGMDFSGAPFVITSFGFGNADKQLESVIRAIACVPEAARSQIALLVVGETRPGDPDPMLLAARYGCADRVRALGWLKQDDADRLLLAADLVMALRFPSRGESSGALARALGLGCAVVVSDHGSYAELPDEAAIKLPARPDPSDALRALMVELIADRSRIVRARHAAYAYAHACCDPVDIAARHWRIARGEEA